MEVVSPKPVAMLFLLLGSQSSEAGPKTRAAPPAGCAAFALETAECFANTLSTEHHDMATAVGGPAFLAAALKRAGAVSAQLRDGDNVLMSFSFDGEGRLVRQEGQTHHYAARYEGDKLIEYDAQYPPGKLSWTKRLSSTGPGDCSVVTAGFGAGTLHCTADEKGTVRRTPNATVRGEWTKHALEYDMGAWISWDTDGRVGGIRASGQTIHLTYTDSETVESRIENKGPNVPLRSWKLDGWGLPSEQRSLLTGGVWTYHYVVRSPTGETGELAPPTAAQTFAMRSAACDAGDFRTCRNLAFAASYCGQPDNAPCSELAYFASGDDTQVRYRAFATKQYVDTCYAGDSTSCKSAHWRLSTGQGAPKDLRAAALAAQKGCDLASSPSCYLLGVAFRDGLGVKANADHARYYLSWCCLKEQADACDLTAALGSGKETPGRIE